MTGYKNHYIIEVLKQHRDGFYGNKNLVKGWEDFDSNTRLWTRGRADNFFWLIWRNKVKLSSCYRGTYEANETSR